MNKIFIFKWNNYKTENKNNPDSNREWQMDFATSFTLTYTILNEILKHINNKICKSILILLTSFSLKLIVPKKI